MACPEAPVAGGLAWALWTLVLLGLAVTPWLNQQARQAGRSDLGSDANTVVYGLVAVSAATVGTVLARQGAACEWGLGIGMAAAYRWPMTGNRERLALASFLASALLAGGNGVSIRFSNRELAPLWGAGLRFALAAALLLAVMAVRRLALPHGRALTGALLYGTLNFGAAFALAYYALVRLHAGLGQTLLALVPLATLLLAVAQGQERLRAAAVAGTLLALAGVAVISQGSVGASVPLASLLAAVASAVCIAQAAVLVRRFPPVHPVTMNAVGMTTGAVLLLAGSVLGGEPHRLPQRAATWAAVGYLVVIGSVVVFVLYLVVLRYWAASRAAYGFVLIPFVTVVLSAWLDDEPLGVGLLVGGLLVLAGVYVGALRPTGPPPTPGGTAPGH